MRSLIIVTMLGLGGTTFGATQGLIPVPDQMARAIVALGGNPASVQAVRVNPLRETYDEVMRKVTAPNRSPDLGFKALPGPVVNFDAARGLTARPPVPGAGAQAATQRALSDIQHMNDRTRAMADYTRNPGAFRFGPPR